MDLTVGIYRIELPPASDTEGFEKAMRSDVFPRVGVGRPTRGGTVTAQRLLRGRAPDHDYLWVVRWENVGGSPFGSGNTPPDPADILEGFRLKTSYYSYELLAEETPEGEDRTG